MTNKLSDLGDSIFVDGYDGERIVTLKADGTAKAAHLVGQAAGDGIARGVDIDGNLDEFDGIQMKRYDVDLDSAPTAGDVIQVAYPKSGHRYRIHIADPSTVLYPGEPMIFHATDPGQAYQGGAAEAEHIFRLSKEVANGDRYCEGVWGN